MLATSNGCPEKIFLVVLWGLIPLVVGPLGLSRLVVVIFFFLGVIFFLGGHLLLRGGISFLVEQLLRFLWGFLLPVASGWRLRQRLLF